MKPKKHNKQKDLLFILISSFIVVVAWIAFNLYHIWVTSTVSQDIQMELTPIDPNFDPATMQELKQRENINPQFQQQAVASPSAEPTVIPSPSPVQITPESSQNTPTSTPAINRQGQ